MRRANVFNNGIAAGCLEEIEKGSKYRFFYYEGYSGFPVSLTMPVSKKEFFFDRFPPFFDGLLPEGLMLEGLLRRGKIDRNDLFSQLMYVGGDMVGSVTVEELNEKINE